MANAVNWTAFARPVPSVNLARRLMTAIPIDLIEALHEARSVVCFTGAGVSAESGVPTFRDAQGGFWQQYRPEDLATPEGFERNPKLVWEWYAWRRKQVFQIQPNLGHVALAGFQDVFPTVTIVTQNIDGLHQRAGSRHVLELHGSLSRTKCSADHRVVESWEETNAAPPACPHCGAYLRPDVVWFGEVLPADVMNRALQASRKCDVFFSIGTSSLVYPAASIPHEALSAGATLIEINPETTPLSDQVHYVLRGPSGEVLPQLRQALEQRGLS
jgi:NAD-dependent deacetylase